MNKLETKTFFTALLKTLLQTDGNRVEKWIRDDYHKNLERLSKILDYDFKNFKLGLPPEKVALSDDYQGTDAVLLGAGDIDFKKETEIYNKEELILKLNHLLLIIDDLNKKI